MTILQIYLHRPQHIPTRTCFHSCNLSYVLSTAPTHKTLFYATFKNQNRRRETRYLSRYPPSLSDTYAVVYEMIALSSPMKNDSVWILFNLYRFHGSGTHKGFFLVNRPHRAAPYPRYYIIIIIIIIIVYNEKTRFTIIS